MSYFSSLGRCVCRLAPLAARARLPRDVLPQQPADQLLSGLRAAVPAVTCTLTRQVHHTPFCGRGSELSPSAEEEYVPERLYSKLNIKIKGADYRVLESYCRFVITAGKALDINIGARLALPTRVQKFTVLKSAHIFKKHRVQYEVRTHMRLMQVKKITGTTADIFLEYVQRNLPEGVSMAVYLEKMDTIPTLLTSPPEGEEPEVKKVSKKKAK